MKTLFAALAVLLACNMAHAASGMVNLYIQSAAAWERCTGDTITPDQAANLSALIARHSLETVAPDELLSAIEKARITTPASCELPLVKVDREYFENFVLPRISASAEVPETTSARRWQAGKEKDQEQLTCAQE